MAELDVGFARQQFPPLANGWAFFENAGGSYAPKSVIERVHAYMTEVYVQPGANYPTSAEAQARIDEGHRQIAALINASPEEVVVGPSTSANVYFLVHALRPWFKPGDEVIVTNLDHAANQTWRRLAEWGVVLREWQVRPDTLDLDLDDLAGLLGPRTRLVCVTHCSNITGSINDVAEIARRCHAAGALLFVDGVAYAPHAAVDVKALGVDFYVFSAYKVYGPHLGVLYGKREHLLKAHGQNHDFFRVDELPGKIQAGYPNHELTAGLAGLGDYVEALHDRHFQGRANTLAERARRVFELIARHEQAIATPFVEFLRSRPEVRLLGRPTADRARRMPTFAFTVKGRASASIPPLLESRRVALRHGDFYAPRLLRSLGLDPADGVIRASMVHYNSAEDVSRLIEALGRALDGR